MKSLNLEIGQLLNINLKAIKSLLTYQVNISHLLECSSPEVYNILYELFGDTANKRKIRNIIAGKYRTLRCVVRKQNKLVTVMDMKHDA